ncbi:murein biosynthesis integral membrane protein MurJ [Clostridium sp.]
MNKNNLIKSTGIIIFISLMCKIFGLIRDVAIASYLGATLNTDAYTMSLTIPNILFGIVGTAIATTFIPILSESYKNNGKQDMYRFSNSIINLIIILSVCLCIIGWNFAPWIVNFIAPKFTGEKYALTVQLTRISVLNLLFMGMTAGFSALLQTMNDFMAPTLVGMAISIPIIIYITFGSKFGIYGLNVATLLGYGLQVFIQIPWLIKNGYRYSFKIDLHDSRIKKMLGLIAPVLIGAGVNEINTVVDRIMASGLPDGSIASLDFAMKTNNLVYTIFAMAIVTVVYSTLCMEGVGGDYTKFKGYVSKSINNINMVMIPSAIGLMVLRYTVVSVLFKRGAFDDNAVSMTATALLFLASGMVFYGIRDVSNRVFYALQDTKTPMVNGIIGVGACIIMNLIIVPIMGLNGLALANTISAAVCTALLIKDLRKRIGSINGREILDSGARILLSSIIMGVAVYGTNKFMTCIWGEFITLVCSMLVGMSVYFIMLMVLNVREFKLLLRIVINKGGK